MEEAAGGIARLPTTTAFGCCYAGDHCGPGWVTKVVLKNFSQLLKQDVY